MTEQDLFESRLAAALRRRADGAPTVVDAGAIARSAAASQGTSGRSVVGFGFALSPSWLIMVVSLLALLAVGAVLVAGLLLRTPHLGVLVPTGPMSAGRDSPKALRLLDGRVLVVGGSSPDSPATELYDPEMGAFAPSGAMTTPERVGFAAALLRDGRVLVVGGFDTSGDTIGTLPFGESYDPDTGVFTRTGPMVEPRRYLWSLLTLPDGRVLVAGDESDAGILASVEMFDPVTGTFSGAGSLIEPRTRPTLSLLPDGRVLVAGGWGLDGPLASAEIYDPATGTSTPTSPMAGPRDFDAAITLSDGRVLLVGGEGGTGTLTSVEAYDPATGTFRGAGSLLTERSGATLAMTPDGRVVVAGGANKDGSPRTTELYDPASGTSQVVGRLAIGADGGGESGTVASALEDGSVLLVGGQGANAMRYFPPGVAARGMVSPPVNSTAALGSPASVIGFASVSGPGTLRTGHTATRLLDGRVLITGGRDGGTEPILAGAEIYDPVTGATTPTGSMSVARTDHAAALLHDGRVLVVGGGGELAATNGGLASAELYDPDTGAFTSTGSPAATRRSTGSAYAPSTRQAFALTLPDGRVLIAGGDALPDSFGSDSVLPWSVEIYDPGAGRFSLVATRDQRPPGLLSATLLADGRVLMVSQEWGGGVVTEIYDPVRDTWTATHGHAPTTSGTTTVVLADGRVLLMGGQDAARGDGSARVELWDPVHDDVRSIGSMGTPRIDHTATLLPDGRVLVVGGRALQGGPDGRLSSAELWDPSTLMFEPAGTMSVARAGHTATQLEDGRVLVVGGASRSPDRVDPDPPFAELFTGTD
jgi:hypothetical protein